MSENIFAAAFRADETKPFGIVEPLNSTLFHASTSFANLIQVRWNKPGSERGLFKTSPTLEIQFRELGRAVKHLTGARAGMNQKFEAVNAIDRNVTDVADANDR